MEKSELIKDSEELITNLLSNVEKGHDYNHAIRVLNNAMVIYKKIKKGNLEEIQIAALFHDIFDKKNNINYSYEEFRIFLLKHQVLESSIEKILFIIENMSFSNIFSFHKNLEKSIEFKIVQDADFLDAIGAIGIARVFHYSGYKNTNIYDNKEIKKYENTEEYHNSNSSALNHFYEKLFLIEEMMNTKVGLKIAKKRTKFMKKYVKLLKQEIAIR